MSEQEKGARPDAAADAKRQAAPKGALSQIEKQFGKGTVMRMGDPGARVAVDVIPTGALSLDIALGVGGVPRGRIVEIFGPESSGKTTLVYHILAEAQKLGGVCAFIDAEHAMDPLYAKQIGVDIDELLVSQPRGLRARHHPRKFVDKVDYLLLHPPKRPSREEGGHYHTHPICWLAPGPPAGNVRRVM